VFERSGDESAVVCGAFAFEEMSVLFEMAMDVWKIL